MDKQKLLNKVKREALKDLEGAYTKNEKQFVIRIVETTFEQMYSYVGDKKKIKDEKLHLARLMARSYSKNSLIEELTR